MDRDGDIGRLLQARKRTHQRRQGNVPVIAFPDTPSRTRNELFERMRAVIAHGPYTMPEGMRYNGTGAPGLFLEDLLGTTAGAQDIPDAAGWELKWHSDRTRLVTLFHKEPDGPEAIMRYMVRRYGRRDTQGRLSFRHTIKGRSGRFPTGRTRS